MSRRTVYVIYGDGEDALAEELVRPLRAAGYDVAHHGTVEVGNSLVDAAAQALASNCPIVLCATARAVGSAWAHRIAGAAHIDGHVRVFVVQMEQQAYVEQLALKTKVARYWEDPQRAIRDLLAALAKHFPPRPDAVVASAEPAAKAPPIDGRQFLDQPTESMTFDVEALGRFRSQLRDEVVERFPAALTAWEFLDRAGLRSGGLLTRTGALLFADNLAETSPAAMVKCTQYHGPDRAAARDTATFTGTVPDQIIEARQFVAARVRAGEAPSAEQAQAAVIYDYPMVAVREIIANALVHRDYTVTDKCVHVRLFPERLEVSSPGDWLGGDLTDGVEHNLADLAGQSIKRNFRLAHILSWIRLVEGEGSGIPAALHDCRAANSPEPTVMQAQGFVTVTLRRGRPPVGPVQAGQWQAVVPMGIPADTGYYVGREAELAELDAILPPAEGGGVSRPRIAVITGMAGVGKSALAVHWAHRVRDRFPDGMLYVNLRGVDTERSPVTPAEAVRSLLAGLGIPPERIPPDVDGLVAFFRSLVHDRRILLLLDDANNPDQVRPLLPGGPASTVLITSRNRLTPLVALDGAGIVQLEPLGVAEAREYLIRRLGHDRVEAESHAADILIERCARLPLALAIVAAQAAAIPDYQLSELAAELSSDQSLLDALSIDDDADASMRSVLATSYRALRSPAAQVFRLLGVHPGPDIGAAAAVALSGFAPAGTRRALAELVRHNLLDEFLPGRYRLHSLLRAYAVERGTQEETDAGRSEAMDRVADYYLRTGITAALQLNPHRESIAVESSRPDVTPTVIDGYERAMGWFTAEEACLLAMLDHAVRLGHDLRAWRLAWVLAPFLDLQGNLQALVASQKIALAAAERLGDAAGAAAAHRYLARAYNRLDRDDEAETHLQHALAIYRRLDDRDGQANTLYDLAEIRGLQHRNRQAMTDAQAALELYEAVGNASGARDAAELISGLSAQEAPERTGHDKRTGAGHRTIIVTDVAGFGDRRRTNRDQSAVRNALYRVLHEAFAQSGIRWNDCYREDRGDGAMILAPPDIPTERFVDQLPMVLAAELRRHNRTHPATTEIRLRMAVHIGEVHFDAHGVVGSSINMAFRLLDSSPLKAALAKSRDPLALITSDWVYDEVVRHSSAVGRAQFRRVAVRVKESPTTAWIWLVPARKRGLELNSFRQTSSRVTIYLPSDA